MFDLHVPYSECGNFYKLQTEQIYQHGAPGCKQKPNQTSTRIKLWVFPDVDQDGSGLAFPDVDSQCAGYMCTYYHYIIPSTHWIMIIVIYSEYTIVIYSEYNDMCYSKYGTMVYVCYSKYHSDL